MQIKMVYEYELSKRIDDVLNDRKQKSRSTSKEFGNEVTGVFHFE